MNLQGHSKRILIALVVIPILVIIVVKLPSYFFFVLIGLVNLIATGEFLKMYRVSNTYLTLGILISTILFILNCFYWPYAILYYSLSFIIISTIRLFEKKQPQNALKDISPLVIGILYIPTLLVFLWFLRQDGWQWIIYLFTVVWASDSFAYYIGKGFGKRKLYPEVSPKKTWEGAVGSVSGGILASVVIGYLINLEKSFQSLILLGFLIGFISILGDLVESMFKRDAGVKDSSILFSEHGGVLDKIDAMLFAGIALYFSLRFL